MSRPGETFTYQFFVLSARSTIASCDMPSSLNNSFLADTLFEPDVFFEELQPGNAATTIATPVMMNKFLVKFSIEFRIVVFILVLCNFVFENKLFIQDKWSSLRLS